MFEKPASLPNGLVTSDGIHTLIEMGILDAPHEVVKPGAMYDGRYQWDVFTAGAKPVRVRKTDPS